jgi:integrase
MRIIKDKRKGGGYVVKYWTPHGRREKSLGTKDKTEAKQLAEAAGIAKLEQAARAGGITAQVVSNITHGSKVLMPKAADLWAEWLVATGASARTVDNYRLYVDPFCRRHRELSPSGIDEAMIEEVVNDPSRKEQRTTRTTRLTALRSFFGFCSAKGLCLGNPAKLVRGIRLDQLSHEQREIHSHQPFTDEEVAELLAETELGGWWHTAIALGRYTGMRLGDIAQLEWSCFAKPGYVEAWTDKTQQRVSVPLDGKPLIDALAVVEARHKTYLFPEQRDTQLSPTRRAGLSVQFSRLCASLDIKGRSFHGLRSTCAMAFERDGRPLWWIADALGHAYRKRNFAMTERYLGRK